MKNTNNGGIENVEDFYNACLTVKNCKYGSSSTWLTKKQAKECNIPWSFVEATCKLLNLNLARHGAMGFVVSQRV